MIRKVPTKTIRAEDLQDPDERVGLRREQAEVREHRHDQAAPGRRAPPTVARLPIRTQTVGAGLLAGQRELAAVLAAHEGGDRPEQAGQQQHGEGRARGPAGARTGVMAGRGAVEDHEGRDLVAGEADDLAVLHLGGETGLAADLFPDEGRDLAPLLRRAVRRRSASATVMVPSSLATHLDRAEQLEQAEEVGVRLGASSRRRRRSAWRARPRSWRPRPWPARRWRGSSGRRSRRTDGCGWGRAAPSLPALFIGDEQADAVVGQQVQVGVEPLGVAAVAERAVAVAVLLVEAQQHAVHAPGPRCRRWCASAAPSRASAAGRRSAGGRS